MRRMLTVLLACAAVSFGILWAAQPDLPKGLPQYSDDNRLLRPENYREWIYLSSGMNMNYSPKPGDHDMFTNVFVPQWVYKEFQNSGKWPDKSVFVVEERGSESKGSINKQGHYQSGDLMGIGVEVKDENRFPDKWAYFGFGSDAKSAQAAPKGACWRCHEDHAAVEHTFVQFYPTLKSVAQKFGTYKQEREKVE